MHKVCWKGTANVAKMHTQTWGNAKHASNAEATLVTRFQVHVSKCVDASAFPRKHYRRLLFLILFLKMGELLCLPSLKKIDKSNLTL